MKSHMYCQSLSKNPLGIQHSMWDSDSFYSLSRIDCISKMSHFCSNLKDIPINNRNRVSNNLSNMMCIDLVTYCRIYKDSGIANISLSTNQCTFHQDIEAHTLHNKWLSLYLTKLFHLKHLKTLLYKKYIKYCQDIINKDLNISHKFCDNCLYNTF